MTSCQLVKACAFLMPVAMSRPRRQALLLYSLQTIKVLDLCDDFESVEGVFSGRFRGLEWLLRSSLCEERCASCEGRALLFTCSVRMRGADDGNWWCSKESLCDGCSTRDVVCFKRITMMYSSSAK